MRQLIVVDVESTSLLPTAAILEIAAVNVTTGEELYFVPWVTGEELGKASRVAMQVNRYYERGVFENQLSRSSTTDHYWQLREMLVNNTFGGSNPAFDAGLVKQVDLDHIHPPDPMGEVWHHRLAALESFAGPAMGRPPWDLPGNAAVCEFLGVTIDGEHTALGDARATAECFRRLIKHYGIEAANG